MEKQFDKINKDQIYHMEIQCKEFGIQKKGKKWKNIQYQNKTWGTLLTQIKVFNDQISLRIELTTRYNPVVTRTTGGIRIDLQY